MTEAGKTISQGTHDPSQLLLQVHLYEYQALTTRATYYVVMSTAIWPLIFFYLGFLTTIWQRMSGEQSTEYAFPLMVWGGGIGAQLALTIWTFLVCEQYKMVLYVERELRPLVHDLVRTPDFWLYEQKLRGRTPLLKWLELQTELWVFILMVAAVVIRILTSHQFSEWDWIGLTLNLVVLVALILLAISAGKIRHKWES